MRKIREVLRLSFEQGLSPRQIQKSCQVARTSVQEYIRRAIDQNLTSWDRVCALDDTALERRLYPPKDSGATTDKVMPPMEHLYQQMRRKGVTLQLLWYEYRQEHPDGYQYSYFCEQYRAYVKKLDPPMRQQHRAGRKLYVDWAGQTIDIVEQGTGEVSRAHLFIAALGASNYTYVEAFPTEELAFWIKGHVHAFEFFHGVPEILVPDNLKTGVTSPHLYEPDLNPTYLDLAQHYDTAVIPARSKKPRDKAKVEHAVLHAERWILAALRNHTFFSISELNKAIKEKLDFLNRRPMQLLKKSRWELFSTIDRPALKPLPATPYQFTEWRKAKVHIDYHVLVDHNFYSVPYQLCHEQVDVRLSDTTVEILFKNRRVASHHRSYLRGQSITQPEHMPKNHQKHLEWTPSRIINWAAKTGPCTRDLVTVVMEGRRHPEQGFRSCLGIMRLGKRYGEQRLEAAAQRALRIRAFSCKSVENILKSGFDQQELFEEEPDAPAPSHANLRGTPYYK